MKTQNTLKTSIIAALMIIVTATTAAQAQADQTEIVRNSLTGGSWSMQFRIADNFSLSSFEGSTISLKKHFTDKSALRLGVSVSYDKFDANTGSSRTTNIDDYDADRGLHQSNFDVREGVFRFNDGSRTAAGVTATYIYYPSPTKKINVFFGAGPSARYSKSTRTTMIDYPISVDSTIRNAGDHDEQTATTWSVGANLACGAEWFVSKNISFMAEYSLSAYYNKSRRNDIESKYRFEIDGPRSRTSEIDYYTDSITDGFSVNSSNVKFGISVYF